MARRRWIRLDVTWADSDWMFELTGNQRRLWPALLCYVKLAGIDGQCKRLSPRVLAEKLNASVEDARAFLSAATTPADDGVSALQVVENGKDWLVTNWTEHQAPQDATGAERQRRRREKQGMASTLRVISGEATA